jgi:hypothetical protein
MCCPNPSQEKNDSTAVREALADPTASSPYVQSFEKAMTVLFRRQQAAIVDTFGTFTCGERADARCTPADASPHQWNPLATLFEW